MNLKISQLVLKLEHLKGASHDTKYYELNKDKDSFTSEDEIELAISISDNPELANELFNEHQRVDLFINLRMLQTYLEDIYQLAITNDGLTVQETATYLYNTQQMLNGRVLK